MKGRSPSFTNLPLDIVGSTKFGRYPKISQEQTWNQIISDGFLVPYAGYKIVTSILNVGEGRGLFTSIPYNHMIAVISNSVYAINTDLTAELVGTISTYSGTVFIDENNANQIAICDMQAIYIFNYIAGTFLKVSIPNNFTDNSVFIPGYISFQNGRFISTGVGSNVWRLSDLNDGTSWPADSFHTGLLQTKTDTVVAAQRFPGRGNLLHLFGKTVTEPWQDLGLALFPYQRDSSVNLDYGLSNPASLAYLDTFIVGIFSNEKSGPIIGYTQGTQIKRISTDGIDFQLASLKNPTDNFGFLTRQDGHLIYQFTFKSDNLSYIYDFNTDAFFNVSDPNTNAHIAKRVVFFNNSYYFVSTIDGNVYQMSSTIPTYNGAEIPRIRITKPVRMPDASRFAINNLTFTIETGTQDTQFAGENLTTDSLQTITTDSGLPIQINVTIDQYQQLPLLTDSYLQILTDAGAPLQSQGINPIPYPIPQSVDLSISKNGGMSFGSYKDYHLPAEGNFRNRVIFWRLGAANEFIPQFRFHGLSRFVATDGMLMVYQ